MPQEENRSLVRAYYEAVYNRGELDRMGEFLAAEFEGASPAGRVDRAGQAASIAASRAALPDFALTIEEQVAEGEAVVTRWSATGTQLGPFAGIPPTGRSVTTTCVHIHHVRGGRIVDQWEQFDRLGVLGQLGLVPQPAARQA